MTPVAEIAAAVVVAVSPWRRWTWRDLHPTHRQRAVLVDRGYRVPATRGEASDLIGELLNDRAAHD